MTAKRAAPLHRTLYAGEEHTLNIDPEIASVNRNRDTGIESSWLKASVTTQVQRKGSITIALFRGDWRNHPLEPPPGRGSGPAGPEHHLQLAKIRQTPVKSPSVYRFAGPQWTYYRIIGNLAVGRLGADYSPNAAVSSIRQSDDT
jgi:hypothetical protein